MPSAAYFVLLLTLTAMILDLSNGKIGNLLTLTGIAAGLLYHTIKVDFTDASFGSELWSCLAGIGLPFLCGYPLFRFRMIGAGDVKLFMAVGSFIGPLRIIEFMAVSIVCGALISLPLIMSIGVKERFRYLADYLTGVERGEVTVYRKDKAAEVHFSVPVFMAALLFAGGVF